MIQTLRLVLHYLIAIADRDGCLTPQAGSGLFVAGGRCRASGEPLDRVGRHKDGEREQDDAEMDGPTLTLVFRVRHHESAAFQDTQPILPCFSPNGWRPEILGSFYRMMRPELKR